MQTIILPTSSMFELWAKQADTDWTLIGTYESYETAEAIQNDMIAVNNMVNTKGLQVN